MTCRLCLRICVCVDIRLPRRGIVKRLTGMLASATAGLFMALSPMAAYADASLIETTPEREAQVDAGDITSVTFRFNQKIHAPSAIVEVDGPDEISVATGKVSVDGAAVSLPIATDKPGTYRAAYRVVSSDGHPVTGVLTFEVRQATASASASEPSPTESPSRAAG